MRQKYTSIITLYVSCFFISKAVLAGPLFDYVYRNQPPFFTQEQANNKAINFLNDSQKTSHDAGYLYRISTDLYEHLYPNSALPTEMLENILEDYDTILQNIREFRTTLIDFDSTNNINNFSDVINIYFDAFVEITVRNLKNQSMLFLPQGNLDENLSKKLLNARHEWVISQNYSQAENISSLEKKLDEVMIAYFNDLRDSVVNVKNLLSLGQKGIKERVLRSKLSSYSRVITQDLPLLSNYRNSYADEVEEIIFEFSIYNNFLKGFTVEEPSNINGNLQRFQELLTQIILDVKNGEHHQVENAARILTYRDDDGFSIIDDKNEDEWDSDDTGVYDSEQSDDGKD